MNENKTFLKLCLIREKTLNKKANFLTLFLKQILKWFMREVKVVPVTLLREKRLGPHLHDSKLRHPGPLHSPSSCLTWTLTIGFWFWPLASHIICIISLVPGCPSRVWRSLPSEPSLLPTLVQALLVELSVPSGMWCPELDLWVESGQYLPLVS